MATEETQLQRVMPENDDSDEEEESEEDSEEGSDSDNPEEAEGEEEIAWTDGADAEDTGNDGVEVTSILAMIGRRFHRRGRGQGSWPRLVDLAFGPLGTDLAMACNRATMGTNKRRRCAAPSLDWGVDASNGQLYQPGPCMQCQPHAVNGSRPNGALLADLEGLPSSWASQSKSTVMDCAQAGDAASTSERLDPLLDVSPARSTRSRSRACTSAAEQDISRKRLASQTLLSAPHCPFLDHRTSPGAVHDSTEPPCVQESLAPMLQGAGARLAGVKQSHVTPSGSLVPNAARMLIKRETGLTDTGSGFSRSQQAHLCCRGGAIPRHPVRLIDEMRSRAYIGQFTRDGQYFVVGFQDQRVRVYDVHRGWKLRKDVRARGVRWTVTDTCVSPDQRFLLYASINPTVHLVALGSSSDGSPVESINNITEVHEALHFDQRPDTDNFGIWSVRWSGDGRDIIAGTNNQSVYVFDVNESKVVVQVSNAHLDDVNAVEYLDESSNLILSGSDDIMIKLWDRRTLDSGRRRSRPVGVLVGHTEGITHMCSRGDGRYLLSNGKDQSVKLWDARMGLRSESQVSGLSRTPPVPKCNWDYRWMAYPGSGKDVRHPHDASLMTYKGHGVRSTLIRAYFSPAATTGQRFVYSGSSDGAVVIWDSITGLQVAILEYHDALVRDVSWHPTEPLLATVSWDGSVVAWAPSTAGAEQMGGKPLHTPQAQGGCRRADVFDG